MKISYAKVLPALVLISATLFLTACQFVLPSARTINTSSSPSPSPSSIESPVVSASPLVTQTQTATSTFTYSCQSGQTAFTAMQSTNITMDVKETSFGKMITSIDGKAQSDNKYWQYKINGQDAPVGAEAYNCHDGDSITWELK